ncbi:MAG: hypothetical protein RIC14_09000 [Filomicrobium sp.]
MSDLEERAAELVNSASGIANDFLNHFNEILLLIENLPVLLPEMMDDLLRWRPQTYVEYFEKSNLPGSARTLETYRSIDPDFRHLFEARVDALNLMAEEYIDVISEHRKPDGSIVPEEIEEYCEKMAPKFRAALAELAEMVNHGYASSELDQQGHADQLMRAAV